MKAIQHLRAVGRGLALTGMALGVVVASPILLVLLIVSALTSAPTDPA